MLHQHRDADEIDQVRNDIAQLNDELLVREVPDDHLGAGQDLSDRLTRCTRIWIDKYRGGGKPAEGEADLGDWWLRLMFTFGPRFEEWTELVFLSWGAHILPDIIAEICDGELEYDIEHIYFEIYKHLPRVDCMDRLAHAKQKLRYLEEGMHTNPLPHRPLRTGTANVIERRFTSQRVPSQYGDQADWLAALREVRWKTSPPDAKVPLYDCVRGRPHFLVVHLFSGRRRAGDLHECLDAWAATKNVQITVLSMDTANSVTYGNLQLRAAAWKELVQCYRNGWVAATVAGTPCETFSEARHHPLTPEGDPGGEQKKGPRPLRSFQRLLGLECLTVRVAQLRAGSCFFLQGVWLLAFQIVTGGIFVSEHPAPPTDESRASIWTSPWLRLLRDHPDMHLHVVSQWRFGASVVKPTGLLALRMPYFLKSLYKHADDELRRPSAVAIGRNSDGSFKTSCHKEYPPRFSAGIAQALTDHFDFAIRQKQLYHGCCDADRFAELCRWVSEAQEANGTIRETANWLPDYQGHQEGA